MATCPTCGSELGEGTTECPTCSQAERGEPERPAETEAAAQAPSAEPAPPRGARRFILPGAIAVAVLAIGVAAWQFRWLLPVREPEALMPSGAMVVVRLDVTRAWDEAKTIMGEDVRTQALKSFNAEMGVDLEKDVLDCLGTPLGVSMAMGKNMTEPPTVTLVAPLKNKRKALQTADKLADKLKAESGGKIVKERHLGVPMWTVQSGQPSMGPAVDPSWAHVRGCVVFSATSRGVREAIECGKGKRESVARDARMAKVYDALPDDAVMKVYYDIEGALSSIPQMPGMEAVKEQMKAMDGMGYSVSCASSRVRMDAIVRIAKGKEGEAMRKFASLGKLSGDALGYVPDGSVGFAAFNNFGAYCSMTKENLDRQASGMLEMMPPKAKEAWEAYNGPEWAPVRELLAALDGELAISLLGVEPGQPPELLVAATTNDAGKLSAAVQRVEAALKGKGLSMVSETHDGLAMKTLTLGPEAKLPANAKFAAVPKLAYTVTDGVLLLAVGPGALVKAAQTKQGKARSIAANADLVALQKELPKECWSLAFFDVKALGVEELLAGSPEYAPATQVLARFRGIAAATEQSKDSARSVFLVGAGTKDIAEGIRLAAKPASEAFRAKMAEQMGGAGAGGMPGMTAPSALEGKPAPDFKLDTLDGKSVQLSKLKGKVVVVDFWATWCPPCVKEIPILQDFYAAQKGKKMELLMVTDDRPEAVRKFAAEKKIAMPVLLDAQRKASQAYSVRSIPMVVVIDQAGVVRRVHNGFSPEVGKKLTEEVGALLAGKPIPPKPSPSYSPPTSGPGGEDSSNPFFRARANAQRAACQSQMKQMALGMMMYCQDYDEVMPDHRKWNVVLMPYVKSESLFRCPAAEGKGKQYQMSSKVSGMKMRDIADPAGTISIFECDANGRPVYRHDNSINLAFVDGHVKLYPKGTVAAGMWTPKAGD